MAEIGIIASALQIADIGIRLSLRLYTFGETVASADKSIISISENVSLTSTVLKELGQTLDKDQTTRICSPNAVSTADSIVKQCQRIFQEMDHILVKKFATIKSAEKDRKIKSAQTLERLRWPFIKGKIELLTSDLERQKSTLVLMLNVIALAKQEFEKTEASTTIAEQRSLIQDLARSNEGYIHKFEQLRLSCPDGPMNQDITSPNTDSLIPTLQAATAQGFASSSALGAASQRWLSTGTQDFRPESYQGPYTFVPPPDGMRWLLQQYDNLLRALLKEVSEPKYEIAEESRSRIKADIFTSHGREMRHTEQVGYSGAPSLAKSSRYDVQQTPTTNPAALNSPVHFKSTQPLNTGPEYYSRKLSRSPPVMTNSHDATRSQKEDGRPAQPEDQYLEIARTRKRKAPGIDHTASRSFTIQSHFSLANTVEDSKAKFQDAAPPMAPGTLNCDFSEGHTPVFTSHSEPQIIPLPPSGPSTFDDPDFCRHLRTSAIFKRKARRLPRRIRTPKSEYDNDNTEDSAQNVVDRLLATWTTLPVPASRTTFDQDSFSVVDHE